MYKILNASITAVKNGKMYEDFKPNESIRLHYDHGRFRSDQEVSDLLALWVRNGVIIEE